MTKRITQLYDISPEELKKEILGGVREILKESVNQENPDKLLTRKEVAKLLSISLPTLRHYFTRGLLKEHRIGARVLYKYSDIIDSLPQIK